MLINACLRNVGSTSIMKDQEREKKEKRKKNAQKKEDIKATFLHCKDKCVCEGKKKCPATGLKIC